MIKIVTDSVASLDTRICSERNIEVISLYFNRNGVEYRDSDTDLDEFYLEINDMADNPPQTSQPSYTDFESCFKAIAQAGDSLVGVFTSSELSGTFDGALRAARAVKADHIDFEYRLIDSRSNSYDEAVAVLDACDARDEGLDLDGVASAAAAAIPCSRYLFTPESLTFLQKGGRIGGAKALIGNLIQLSPVLTVVDGKAAMEAKVRTRKKALAHILDVLARDIEAGGGLKRLVVHYIGSNEPAQKWATKDIEPLLGRSVEVIAVSPTIGVHVGPAIGIAYQCNAPLAGKVTESPEAFIYAQ